MAEEEMKKHLLFQMDIDTAIEFWERVVKEKANTEEERINILMDLAKQNKLKSISQTNRTHDEIVADYKKHYDDVIDIKKDETICQECGLIDKIDHFIKVTNEGYLCATCSGNLLKEGEDYDKTFN